MPCVFDIGLNPLGRNVTARSPSADSVRTSAPLLPATTAAVQLVLVPNLQIFSRRARRVFLAGEYPDEDPNSYVRRERLTVFVCTGERKRFVVTWRAGT